MLQSSMNNLVLSRFKRVVGLNSKQTHDLSSEAKSCYHHSSTDANWTQNKRENYLK